MILRHWRIATSILISLIILIFAILNRQQLEGAIGLLQQAKPLWLGAAFLAILTGYLVSSQVLRVALHSLGHRLGIMRMWATALVAIMISQSVPAGGVGSYAFLVSIFNRRGISSVQSTLVASLETLSYSTAMLLMFSFSLGYLTIHKMETGDATYIAALVALAIVGSAIFVLSRSEDVLRKWLLGLTGGLKQILRRDWSDEWVIKMVQDLSENRALLTNRRRDILLLVFIQITALSLHSLGLLLVLQSLGVHANFAVVLAAFGIALITSTFNVLPGGGGTVEAALVAILSQLGISPPQAVVSAIIFRLFNFWLLALVAAICYSWLMHEKRIHVNGNNGPEHNHPSVTQGSE